MCKSCTCITNKHYQNNNKNNAYKIYNDNDIKTCSQCKQIKSITDFSKNKTKSDGLQNICKSLESIVRNTYCNNNRQIHVNKMFNENDIRTISKCKQQKLYTEFNKWSSDKSGLESYFKDCKILILKQIINKNLVN